MLDCYLQLSEYVTRDVQVPIRGLSLVIFIVVPVACRSVCTDSTLQEPWSPLPRKKTLCAFRLLGMLWMPPYVRPGLSAAAKSCSCLCAMPMQCADRAVGHTTVRAVHRPSFICS
jgi:hypothetical protein